ncbi:MAG TPA: hypothetical protein PKD90_10440, partial [Phnomibacter sp.]|nr:hypothetical protein [Phnomibacter sp.]
MLHLHLNPHKCRFFCAGNGLDAGASADTGVCMAAGKVRRRVPAGLCLGTGCRWCGGQHSQL